MRKKLSDIERVKRMAGCLSYEREARRPYLWDGCRPWVLSAVVTWGVVAFSIALLASRKWVF